MVKVRDSLLVLQGGDWAEGFLLAELKTEYVEFQNICGLQERTHVLQLLGRSCDQ